MAGLVMAAMDITEPHGEEPTNFLDVGRENDGTGHQNYEDYYIRSGERDIAIY